MPSQNKQRTYARNRVVSRKGRENVYEADAFYMLKLVGAALLGMCWLKFASPLDIGPLHIAAFPVGFAAAVILVACFEKFQFNRKIFYAVLVVVAIISLIGDAGFVI